MFEIDELKAKKRKLIYVSIGFIAIVIILTITISLTSFNAKTQVVAPLKMQTNSMSLAQQPWIVKSSADLDTLQKEIQQAQSAGKQKKQQEQQKVAQNQNVIYLSLISQKGTKLVIHVDSKTNTVVVIDIKGGR